MTEPAFSLVIPCYNEARSLPELVARARMVAEVGEGEVILVDNGSSDDTQSVLAGLLGDDDRVRTIRVEVNRGYGFGITSGLAVARGPIVGWTHADLQTDPADVLRVLPAFAVASNRLFAKGRRYGRPIGDRLFTAGMSVFESALLRTPLRDINAQPTLFHRSLMESWGEPPADFSLDLFAMVKARRARFHIVRFPVLFAPRRFGNSTWNIDFAAKRRFIRRTIDYSLALRKEL